MSTISASDFIAIHNLMGRYGHIMDECSALAKAAHKTAAE